MTLADFYHEALALVGPILLLGAVLLAFKLIDWISDL